MSVRDLVRATVSTFLDCQFHRSNNNRSSTFRIIIQLILISSHNFALDFLGLSSPSFAAMTKDSEAKDCSDCVSSSF